MTITRPVQRLMGKEAHSCGAWHGEVDKLRALEAYEAVGTGDDDYEQHRTDDPPLTGSHVASVSHSRRIGRRFADSSRTGRMEREP
jgi:hypothetical protein